MYIATLEDGECTYTTFSARSLQIPCADPKSNCYPFPATALAFNSNSQPVARWSEGHFADGIGGNASSLSGVSVPRGSARHRVTCTSGVCQM